MKTSRPALWPLIATCVILALIGGCFWALWNSKAADRERAKAQEMRLAELAAERDELAALLKLPPCETAARLDAAQAPAQPAPDAAAKNINAVSDLDPVEKACVFLVSADGASQLSTGSGFFVAPGYVLTNRHVVEKGTGKAFATSAAMGSPALAQVVATGKGRNNDYALLRLDMPDGANTAILPLASQIKKTEKVGAWGYPHLVGENDPAYRRLMGGDLSAAPELSYTEGVISAILPGEPPIIVHTAPISPGNSGGPLLNANGEVVGINSMIQLDSSSYRQASIAIGAAALKSFLAEQGIGTGKP
ncbi:MAG: trypsin-like peptidase domain-containing protein [Desulfovibrio sp.]|nr:trypsin-like peptidase domain-containing protein [Desulfovibrio sp.]